MGHSSHARSMLAKFEIGSFTGGPSERVAGATGGAHRAVVGGAAAPAPVLLNRLMQILLPVLAVLLAVLAYELRP